MQELVTYKHCLETMQVDNIKSIIQKFLSNILNASPHDMKEFAILLKTYGVKTEYGRVYLDDETNPIIKQYCINKLIDELISTINTCNSFPLYLNISNFIYRPTLEYVTMLRSAMYNIGYQIDFLEKNRISIDYMIDPTTIINELGTLDKYLFTCVYVPTNFNPVITRYVGLIYNKLDKHISKDIRLFTNKNSDNVGDYIIDEWFAKNDITQIDKNINDAFTYLGSVEQHLTQTYSNDLHLLCKTHENIKNMLSMIVCDNILRGSNNLMKWFEINGVTYVNGNMIMSECVRQHVEQIRHQLLDEICKKILTMFKEFNLHKISLNVYEIIIGDITFRPGEYIIMRLIDWLKTNGYEKSDYTILPNRSYMINIDMVINSDNVILQQFMKISPVKSARGR